MPPKILPGLYQKKPVNINALQIPTEEQLISSPATYTSMLSKVIQWLIQSLGSETPRTLFDVTDATKIEDLRNKWCHTQTAEGFDCVLIGTQEGVMRADLGDWMAQGVFGEFYPIKPHIFEATYEPAR